ncbi:MAG: ribosome-associated translation inhibitor RaiA [Dehalococcoidia bacterium]
MELTISANHTTLTDAIKDYAEKRLSKLDRRFRQPVPVHLMIRKEGTKRDEDRYIAEVTIRLKRGLIRSEERAATPYAAIDLVEETVNRRIHKYKTRFERKRRETTKFDEAMAAELAEAAVEPEPEPVREIGDGQLVRTKAHQIVPMTVEEAAAQMDLLGHTFYMFLNRETGLINVVYRRHDDDYGLIVPDNGG